MLRTSIATAKQIQQIHDTIDTMHDIMVNILKAEIARMTKKQLDKYLLSILPAV